MDNKALKTISWKEGAEFDFPGKLIFFLSELRTFLEIKICRNTLDENSMKRLQKLDNYVDCGAGSNKTSSGWFGVVAAVLGAVATLVLVILAIYYRSWLIQKATTVRNSKQLGKIGRIDLSSGLRNDDSQTAGTQAPMELVIQYEAVPSASSQDSLGLAQDVLASSGFLIPFPIFESFFSELQNEWTPRAVSAGVFDHFAKVAVLPRELIISSKLSAPEKSLVILEPKPDLFSSSPAALPSPPIVQEAQPGSSAVEPAAPAVSGLFFPSILYHSSFQARSRHNLNMRLLKR